MKNAVRSSIMIAALATAVSALAQQALAPTTLPVVPAPSATQPLPPPHWTLAQVRQAFDLADGDSNGELSRAEAQRLTILPRSFEEMDQNKDGVLTRVEFEAAFGR